MDANFAAMLPDPRSQTLILVCQNRSNAAKNAVDSQLSDKPNPRHRPIRTMTLQEVRQAQAAERAAKDAFYAVHAAMKPGGKPPANYSTLQSKMIAATKARQFAMTKYAATLTA
jgi:gamma-glutamyl:cysteine ligase YbdK (ATP-grasp superfamily)